MEHLEQCLAQTRRSIKLNASAFPAKGSLVRQCDCLSESGHAFLKKNFIGVELIYNVVLVSGVQHSDSVKHIHMFILFSNFFPIWVITEY